MSISSDHLNYALTLVRLAKSERESELVEQHLREIERLIEYTLKNMEVANGEAKRG